MSYKTLQVWKMAETLVIDIHKMSITQLPKFELYEQGSQIRRSIKSVKANLVEGYGRRRYKQDYIRFLVFSLASAYETIDHLETLFKTGSLKDETLYKDLLQRLNFLAGKLNNFIKAVEKKHQSSK